VRESRTHVSVEAKSQTAQDGALFQTSGLEFISVPAREKDGPIPLSAARTLGLVVETDAAVKEGLGFLGGERRVVQWRTGPDQLPACPPAVREAVIARKHCRLILATPAIFDQGLLPDANKLSRFGVSVTVQAVTNGRYQTVSGWDYARNEPKATRRLAPAGSVYFLTLDGDDEAVDQFIDQIWLHAVSDDEQACRDGFGLALIGAWDGALESWNSSREKIR
jgi:CRISPR-associated protein Cmr3